MEILRGMELYNFCRRYKMKKEVGYDYVVKENGLPLHTIYDYNGKQYRLRYASGCFYPVVTLL